MSKRPTVILVAALLALFSACSRSSSGSSSSAPSLPQVPTAPGGPYAEMTVTPPGQAAASLALPPGWLPPAVQLDLSALVEVPDPVDGDNPRYPESQRVPPAVGEEFRESGLDTAVQRVTATPGVVHEYSRFDPFNADKSMVILFDQAFMVFRCQPPYDSRENMVRRLDLTEPRWDRVDPNRVTGIRGLQILSVDVTTGAETLLKDFSEDRAVGPIVSAQPHLDLVTMMGGGEPSLDGNWWALALTSSRDSRRPRYVFCWERSADRLVGLRDIPPAESNIDWVGMSPKGRWVVLGGTWDNGYPLTGLVIADRELTGFHRLDFETLHGDVGLDADGSEVLVMQNSMTDFVDLIPLDPATKPILRTGGGYEGTGRTPLLRLFYESDSPFGFDSSVLVSCNAPGYALISTYGTPDTPERNWLDRSIVLLSLDPASPRAFYVAKTHGSAINASEQARAAIANDGRSVVWVANFGMAPGTNQTYLLRTDLAR